MKNVSEDIKYFFNCELRTYNTKILQILMPFIDPSALLSLKT